MLTLGGLKLKGFVCVSGCFCFCFVFVFLLERLGVVVWALDAR